MVAPFEPVTIVEEFVYATLSADATIDSLVGADNIWPSFSPSGVNALHLTQDFAGPELGNPAVPMGQAIALLSLDWDITAWTPGRSRQALRAVMKRVQELLTGPSIVGKRFSFVSSDTTAWAIACRYRGPVVVPPEVNPTWQRVSSRFRIELRQKS